jgi:hypothetical protein
MGPSQGSFCDPATMQFLLDNEDLAAFAHPKDADASGCKKASPAFLAGQCAFYLNFADTFKVGVAGDINDSEDTFKVGVAGDSNDTEDTFKVGLAGDSNDTEDTFKVGVAGDSNET